METKRHTRIVIIGMGAVGSSYAFALLNQHLASELVLIDVNKNKAKGDALDLNHSIPFASPMKIWAGDYEDCHEASMVVITAGAGQAPGETRLDLIGKNLSIFKSIVPPIMKSGFNGLFVVASNPVDILTYVTWKLSGLPKEHVIGSGTLLDTSRFRYLLGEYFKVDARNVHAQIMGEHGDTEFPVWSHVHIGSQAMTDIINPEDPHVKEELNQIFKNVRDAAYQIIDLKGATYYAIAMGLVRLTRAILHNENAILTVSTLLTGQYQLNDIYIGVPAIINHEGVREIIELRLNPGELKQLHVSADTLTKNIEPFLNTLNLD